MTLSPLHRYYLAQHSLTECLVNIYLNMAIGAYVFRGLDRVPYAGATSIVVDLLATGFILAFVVTLIATFRTRKHLRQGELPRVEAGPGALRVLSALPTAPVLRALILGAQGTAVAGMVLAGLKCAGVESMPFWPCIVMKGGFAGGLAAYTTAVAVVRAFRD